MSISDIRQKVKEAEARVLKEKEASIWGSVKGGVDSVRNLAKSRSMADAMRQGLMLGGASAALTGGAALASGLTNVIGGALQKKVGIRRMYRENAWLDKEDKKDVEKFYSTLHRFAPSMAMDPLVSGSFMKKQLEFKDIGVQPNDLQTIANIERAQRDAKGDRLLRQAFNPGTMGNMMPMYHDAKNGRGPSMMGPDLDMSGG